MIIKLTKHCLQRREHYEKEVPELIKYIFSEVTKNIDLESLEDKVHKINYRSFCCVFQKDKDTYVIITIRGHKRLIQDNNLDKPRLNLANPAFKSTGGFIIRRTNYLGNIVKCGYVVNIAGTEQRLLVLNRNLHKKYNMSEAPWVPKVGLKFTLDTEIKDLVTFNDSEQCYYLNAFDRMQ